MSQPLDPQETAVLVIDVQLGLFQKSTPIYRAKELLAGINALAGRAHQSGAQVVYIQHASDKVLPYGSTGWQLHPQLQPLPGDLRIDKQHGNAFEETPLDAELRARGIRSLVICGLVTHGCVKATCLGALDLGYRVVLAGDAHSSYSKDAARLIEEWNAKLQAAGAEVAPAAEL